MKKVLSLILALVIVVSLGAVAFGTSGSRKADAKKVFSMVNAERKKAGKEPLVWVEELYEPALTRAKELEVNFSHTRPDGSKWNTVSELAQGENISWNRATPEAVMEQWMGSEGHRKNMMGDPYNYTGMAVAVVDTKAGPYWVQLFTLRDVEGSTTTDKKETKKTTTTGSPVVTTPGTAVTTGAAITEPKDFFTEKELLDAAGKAVTDGKNRVNVTQKADKQLKAEAIASLNEWSKGQEKELVYRMDTAASSGKGLQGCFYFNPARFAEQKGNLRFGVYTQGDKVKAVTERFKKWFSNDMVIVYLDQNTTLSGTADLAVKANFSKLDTDNLVFYTYDAESNSYSQQKDTVYKLDSNGFLHFTTQGRAVPENSTGQYIIISDKTLSK